MRGGVEPWLMARWKARVEFLLSVIELLFLSLTFEALQGKMCTDAGSSVSVSKLLRRVLCTAYAMFQMSLLCLVMALTKLNGF